MAFKNRTVHVDKSASEPSGKPASEAYADPLKGHASPLGATLLPEEVAHPNHPV